MRLTHLLLPTLDPASTLAFYRDVLQLPVSGDCARIGWSTLEPVAAERAVGSLHLAFNVAPDRFDAATAWLRERLPLLADPQGRERFRLDGPWQSESVYFAGPDGAVLELIARAPLGGRGAGDGAFHGRELQCLSEVGLPSADVPAVIASVANHFGAQPLAPASHAFAPLGDHEGLLIVVEPRRRWFPELRQLPWAQGLRLTVQGPQAGLRLRDAEGWELLAA